MAEKRTYTTKQIGSYLNKAKKYKDDIRSIYEEIFTFTDTYKTMKDSGKTLFDTQRTIDSDVLDAIDDQVNFIMKGLLPRGSKWADLRIDYRAYKAEKGGDVVAEKQKRELETNLALDTEATFEYLQSSNYYNEVAKAADDLTKVGTGCYRLNETPSATRPFNYNYVSLDNLYIMEDAQSMPNFVFKYHYGSTGEYLYDMFGKDITLPIDTDENDIEKEATVIECVLPSYDEAKAITTFKYMVLSEDLKIVYLETDKNYNPFTVFRSKVLQGNPWGISKVSGNLEILRDLSTYRAVLELQATRIADPAIAFSGDKQILNHLDNTNGAINYIGNPIEAGQSFDIRAIAPQGNLMPLEGIISDLRQRFRASMFSNPLGNVEETLNRTATEISLRHQMFRDKYANMYELLSKELLEPTFRSPFIILQARDLLETKEDVLSVMSLSYINELTKISNDKVIQSYLQYTQYVSQINQAGQFGVTMNMPYVVADIGKRLELPIESIPDEAQLQEIETFKREQALQQQQQAQVAQAQGGQPVG